MNSHLTNINPNAIIGEGTKISPFVSIEDDVIIGKNCSIAPNVVICSGARIGDNVQIYPGAIISAIPQDLKYSGEHSLVKIGDNTIIREYVTVNRGTVANMETVVGKNCMLMAYVHIAHDCVIGDNVIIANSCNLAGHIEVHDWAIIGGASAVHQFVKIGKHSILAGGSLVGKDVPPFIKAARYPLSYAGINSIGLRRRGFSNEQINDIQNVYRKLYLNGMNVTQAVREISATVAISVERDEILSFIANSNRGIIKGYLGRKIGS